MGDRPRSRRKVVEWLLTAIGVVCLAWYGTSIYRAAQYQRSQSLELERAMESSRTESRSKNSQSPENPPPLENPTIEREMSSSKSKPDHQLIGRLEIPRLGLSVMVVDGDDAATLKVAAGHLPDTPLPWEFGNSAVAGHRDLFFRSLSQIRMNDVLHLVTPHGEFNYAVANTRIVKPNDLSVLAQTGRSSLTLITCYPFSYVGRAPRRFIVRADHVPG